MYGTIFESIVNLVYDEESKTEKETKDNEGNIIFKEGKYIPTIYDEGIVIEKAYIRDSRYSEKYSNLNVVELIVIENSNEKVNKYAYGFNRTNIFRYNEKGEWILYSIEGDISISR